MEILYDSRKLCTGTKNGREGTERRKKWRRERQRDRETERQRERETESSSRAHREDAYDLSMRMSLSI